MGCFGSDTAKNDDHDKEVGRRSDRRLDDELSSGCDDERYTLRLRSQVAQRKSTRSGVPGESVSRQDYEAPIETCPMVDGWGVIIIDMQSDEHFALRRKDGTVGEHQIAVLKAAMKAELPIIEITTGAKPTCKALLDEIGKYEHHVHFLKGQPNALDFPTYDGEVARRLAGAFRGITNMVVIGFDASICVQATIFGNTRRPLETEDSEALEEILRLEQEETDVGKKYVELMKHAEQGELANLQKAFMQESAEARRVRKECEDLRGCYVPGILSWGIDVWTSPDVLVGELSGLYGPRQK
jgi:hypothetical protein